MLKPRKVPMRMCVGCREMKPKRELLRIVRNQQGEVKWDPVGKAPGRGAYVCRSRACFTRAVKAKQLQRALEHPVEESVFEKLLEEIAAHEQTNPEEEATTSQAGKSPCRP